MQTLRTFASDHPGLLPEHLREPRFLDHFAATAFAFLDREREIQRYLNAVPDLIALCHWTST